MKSRLLLLAGVVVLVANATALTLVALNRSGRPTNLIELTEREMPIRHRDPESGTVFLQIHFNPGMGEWLGEAKLADLGFDMSVPINSPRAKSHYRRMRTRQVFAVLEYEGTDWRSWLAKQESRIASEINRPIREQLQHERESISRLFAIDAGLNAAALRAKYPDLGKYVIAPCALRVNFWEEINRVRHIQGSIGHFIVNSINVPMAFLSQFRSFGNRPEYNRPPRYRVTVRYGSRYEPEVVEVKTHPAEVR